MFETPILLITFNRPNHTRRVFEEIKKQKPKQLFIFQDGARQNNEADIEKYAAVRAIFTEPLDWDCELKTYYSDKNLGCGQGPATGISWFFEHVEQGIIMEDDTIPAMDFFLYAEELLVKYKEIDRIKVIGSMHIAGKKYDDNSYYFSMMNRNLCAWATWKRVWDKFDYYLTMVEKQTLFSALRKYGVTRREADYWCDRLDEIHKDRLNESSWDIQFLMSVWLENGIGICPNVNLSTNIGFDSEATHTVSSDSKAANVSTGVILPLVHPVKIKITRKADLDYHKFYFEPTEYGWSGFKRMPYRINKRIKRKIGIQGSWISK